MFSAVKSKIDARFIMDNQRIFIANLSKGKLGEDKANLLGSLLVTKFQTAAMGRSDMQEEHRQDFNLCIDEFSSFTTDSFAGILSEARKYRLCLTLANQYIEQMSDNVRAAVFGNVGSILSFRVGIADAEVLASEFGNGYSPEQFTDLSNHDVLVKLSDNGAYRQPFLARNRAAELRGVWTARQCDTAVAGAVCDSTGNCRGQNQTMDEAWVFSMIFLRRWRVSRQEIIAVNPNVEN